MVICSSDDTMLPVRAQGVIQGIGFLCAGTIIKGESLSNVRGLTTAAGLWFTAAIGVAVGMGNEATALVSTFLALVVLHVLPLMIRKKDSDAP
jgi:putative Mg2+ transporter-C (MgtC) family protein